MIFFIKWGNSSTSYLTGQLRGFGEVMHVTHGEPSMPYYTIHTGYYWYSFGATPLNEDANFLGSTKVPAIFDLGAPAPTTGPEGLFLHGFPPGAKHKLCSSEA